MTTLSRPLTTQRLLVCNRCRLLRAKPDESGRRGTELSAKITIHDVARESGVSIKTVSRVLNREPNVKADTRDRVQAAVAALNYRPNISARSLAGSKAYLIGVFFDNPSPGYVTDVQLGAIARCRQEGFHLIVEPIDSTIDVEEQVAPMLGTLRMDGVILTPPLSDHPVVLAALEREGVPTSASRRAATSTAPRGSAWTTAWPPMR
jgi:LacI family transcriptional regulator